LVITETQYVTFKFKLLKKQIIRIIFILVVILPHFNVKSQEGFSVGIQGGAGFSYYFFQDYIDQDFVPVYQYGFVIGHMKDGGMGAQLKILKTQKAWQEKIRIGFKKRVVIDYLEIPFLTSFKIGKNHSSLIINAGIHVSKILNVDSTNYGQQLHIDKSIINYSPIAFTPWNYGVSGGIGYQLTFDRNIMQLELMYSQSLQNLFERDYTKIYRSLNQNLYLSLIYKVSIARKKDKKTTKAP
jgi:hypothetical protein